MKADGTDASKSTWIKLPATPLNAAKGRMLLMYIGELKFAGSEDGTLKARASASAVSLMKVGRPFTIL